MEKIELLINHINKLRVNEEILFNIKNELEEFLRQTNMNSLSFVKEVMLSEEIKSNNLVEGYLDDIEFIDELVKKEPKRKNASTFKEQRVLNLYNGYKYVLKGKEINKENLKKLYSLLSRNLLDEEDLKKMGEYYRDDQVYIFFSSNIGKQPDKGVDFKEVSDYMDVLFEYINKDNEFENQTDIYIKSQIIHFYFVYIHPYFDVNGRTSRTLSMWYLLNNKVYPYVIFNRGINFYKTGYYKAIRETIEKSNITLFLKYMLETVKIELEKEYLIQNIESLTEKLTMEEKQTLNYILSMKCDKNLKTFCSFYRRFNERRNIKEMDQIVLQPLFEKKIILKDGISKSKIYNGDNNYNFKLNDKYIDNDSSKIKRLILS